VWFWLLWVGFCLGFEGWWSFPLITGTALLWKWLDLQAWFGRLFTRYNRLALMLGYQPSQDASFANGNITNE
jgi:hypothetical protein